MAYTNSRASFATNGIAILHELNSRRNLVFSVEFVDSCKVKASSTQRKTHLQARSECLHLNKISSIVIGWS